MHIQDLKDQAGDKVRGRKSVPLVLGEDVARWSIAIPVMVSGILCPLFWNRNCGGHVVPVGLGAVVAGRTLLMRDQKEDERTWKLWAGWTAYLFCLPLVKDYAGVPRLFGSMVVLSIKTS